MRKLSLFLLLLNACATRPVPAPQTDLQTWIPTEERVAWNRLATEISPREPKTPGGPIPKRGAVVAALNKKDPDYYFHWVRDAANVMTSVTAVSLAHRPYASTTELERRLRDYVSFSEELQKQPSKFGLGEPRYNVDGTADTLPWSRPQYDGPALRALSLLRFLEQKAWPVPAELAARARRVLRTDLDFVARIWPERGFDVWEEYRADNYETRVVQLAALEKGASFWARQGGEAKRVARYRQAAEALAKLLDDHWDPARGFLRSQLAIAATDGYTAKKTDLDAAVIVAVVDADRTEVPHSVRDDRVQATVEVLTELFNRLYPINSTKDLGPAFGRYAGDSYFGGNPWYLITAHFAQFYYRLANRLAAGADFPITARNLAFARAQMGGITVLAGQTFAASTPEHRQLIARLRAQGDAIMRRLEAHTPADGTMYEQFDKTDGRPVSARDLAWSYSSFLAAALERDSAN